MAGADGAVSSTDPPALPAGTSAATAPAPTSVSAVVMAASVERYQRSVVAGASPLPSLRTVAVRVKEVPAVGRLSVTEGAATTRSGATRGGGGGSGTVTGTEGEQLLVVSASPETASTHAP